MLLDAIWLSAHTIWRQPREGSREEAGHSPPPAPSPLHCREFPGRQLVDGVARQSGSRMVPLPVTSGGLSPHPGRGVGKGGSWQTPPQALQSSRMDESVCWGDQVAEQEREGREWGWGSPSREERRGHGLVTVPGEPEQGWDSPPRLPGEVGQPEPGGQWGGR